MYRHGKEDKKKHLQFIAIGLIVLSYGLVTLFMIQDIIERGFVLL